jgi:hypothetical protein
VFFRLLGCPYSSFKAFEWTTLTDAQRASVKAQYNAAGIKLVVSVFGSTDVPTSSGVNPVTMVQWIPNSIAQKS